MQVRTVFIILSLATLGRALQCLECDGAECDEDEDQIRKCTSNHMCYRSKNRGIVEKGCRAVGSCRTSKMSSKVVNFHSVSVNNGAVCVICNKHLCNANGTSKVQCYNCAGNECRARPEHMDTCEGFSCYLLWHNRVEERGCTSSQSESRGSANKVHFLCDSEFCNTPQKYKEFRATMAKSRLQVQKSMALVKQRMKEMKQKMAKMFSFGRKFPFQK